MAQIRERTGRPGLCQDGYVIAAEPQQRHAVDERVAIDQRQREAMRGQPVGAAGPLDPQRGWLVRSSMVRDSRPPSNASSIFSGAVALQRKDGGANHSSCLALSGSKKAWLVTVPSTSAPLRAVL